jgi:pimeloyl-ACP methyl ester carboxylesterase
LTEPAQPPPHAVLLHGSADSPAAWRGVAAALAPDFAASAPALPPYPGALGSQALDHDLDWLDGVMAATGARVLAGHSYGALLALRWALRHPGRLDALVLAEPIAWGVLHENGAKPAVVAELERCVETFRGGEFEAAMDWLVDYWNGAGYWRGLPERVRVGLLAGAARTAAEVASGGGDRTSALELAALKVPTWLLAGAATTAESLAASRALAAAIPNATLRTIDGAGHQFLRSHPGVFADAVRDAVAAGV